MGDKEVLNAVKKPLWEARFDVGACVGAYWQEPFHVSLPQSEVRIENFHQSKFRRAYDWHLNENSRYVAIWKTDAELARVIPHPTD